MEYPAGSLGALQSNYQQSQEQSHISPGCNSSPACPPFSSAEVGPPARNYPSYPTPYSVTQDYPNPHNSQPTFSNFPSEGHGQGITLNQLLQQGNVPGNYQPRVQSGPPMQPPFRSYDQFYGYKPGPGSGPIERSQVNPYPYGTPVNQRYPDPYTRPPYTGYPPGPGYHYYQTSAPAPPPQPPQQLTRHPSVSQSDQFNSASPRPPQSTTPASCGGNDRPSSRGLSAAYLASNPMSPQLSSPGTTRQALPFGSPPPPGHRDTHQQQQVKPTTDPSTKTHTPSTNSEQPYTSVADSNTSVLNRSSDGSARKTSTSPVVAGSTREYMGEQTGRATLDSRSADNAPGSVVSQEQCSPSASPAQLHRSTPPVQSPTTYPPQPPSVSSSSSTTLQAQQSGSSPSNSGSPRLPCPPSQQFRPYTGSPGQPCSISRQPYPPGQQYMYAGRSPVHPGYPSRPMAVPGNLGPGRQFPPQSGGTNMPPPAVPPPNAGPSPQQQQNPYSTPYGPGSHWDPHGTSGVPTSVISQQQSFARSSNVCGNPNERQPGYSSPQSMSGPVPSPNGTPTAGNSQPPQSQQVSTVSSSPMHQQQPPQPQFHPSQATSHPYTTGTPPTAQPNASQPGAMGPGGVVSRDPYQMYGHGVPTSDRGPPHQYFGSPAPSGPNNEPGFVGSHHPMGVPRMPQTMGPNVKISQTGMMMKGQRADPGMRPSTPNHLPMNSPPGLVSEECLPSSQHMPAGHSPMLQHPNQHQYPVGWPDGGGLPPNQMNQMHPYGSQPFSHYQQQQQQPYYRSAAPQMHPQYPHGMMNPSPGPPYGGPASGMMPHNMLPQGISPQSSSGFQKLLEMGNEPERRPWLEHYVRFMEDIGKPLVGLPQVVKQPLDLYRFYLAVRERGGVLEVIKARRWKEISQLVNINASASAAYTLRKNYCKFLLDYECRFDRGGADPRPILMHIEAMSGKKKKHSPGDVEPGLSMPAPPSPTGSHSSASSSLLPPGSGSASLSGVPTAGSGTSDSQLGPSQSRTGDSIGGPTNEMPLNGLPNSPAPSAMSAGTPFMSAASIASPQRPNSAQAIVNGYTTPSQGSSVTDSTNARPWPWSVDANVPASSNHSLSMNNVNGFSSSPLKTSSASPAIHPQFDSRPHRTDSPVRPKSNSHSFVPSSSTSASLASTAQSPYACKEPTVHHHPYPPPTSIQQHQPVSNSATANTSLAPHQSAVVSQGPPNSPLHPRLCSPSLMNVRQPQYMINGSTPNSGDQVAYLCMQQYRSTAPGAQPYPQLGMSSFTGNAHATGVPAHLIHHHGQRPGYVATILKRVEHYSFPTGSVEATQIDTTRRKRYRAKDVGPVIPSKLLMALRSGLTTEVAWALNCLNILLRDEGSSEFLTAVQLPSLITNLVDLWRRSLGEVFNPDTFIGSLELPAKLDSIKSRAKSSSIFTPTFHKTMADVEQELLAIATKRNVPITSLRDKIRQLLCKRGKVTLWFPARLRNGLLLTRSDTTSSTTYVSSNNNTSSDPSSTNLRTRKRSKPSNLTVSYNLPLSTNTLTNNLSNLISISSIPQNPTKSELSNALRVVTSSGNLTAPQSLTNLHQLALYALEELGYSDQQSDIPTSKNPAKVLTELLIRGGGDTTCHIMPPFGAASLPSTDDHIKSMEDTRADCASTPPPVVSKEKCILPDGGLVGDDEDDGHLDNKRARRASASSLGCPVLSPQPLDDREQQQQVADDPMNDTDDKLCGTEEEDGELSKLVMDSEGRCPLRAREELVQYGLASLWPDHPDLDASESRAVRCLCVSTVLRNLSFVSAVEHQLSTQRGLLSLIGRVLLLGHDHVGPSDTWQTVEIRAKQMNASLCAWRTPSWVEDMRENALVLLVNIAGYLKLIDLEESIVRPILEGLLHWIICTTAASTDPFPGHRTLSPRRLALEAVNRLSVHQSNVDLLLSTPAVTSADVTKLFDRLAHWLAIPEDQVTRELALSTMHYLTGGGLPAPSPLDHIRSKGFATEVTSSTQVQYIGITMLANAKPCPISGLLSFIEATEATTRRVIEQCGVQALQERPELMGTSLEMIRRAGALLDRLAADPTGRDRFTPDLELRLLDLVTSRVLDATVAHLLCGALHRLSGFDSLITSPSTPFNLPKCPSLTTVAHILKNADADKNTKPESSVSSKGPTDGPSEQTQDDPSEPAEELDKNSPESGPKNDTPDPDPLPSGITRAPSPIENCVESEPIGKKIFDKPSVTKPALSNAVPSRDSC